LRRYLTRPYKTRAARNEFGAIFEHQHDRFFIESHPGGNKCVRVKWICGLQRGGALSGVREPAVADDYEPHKLQRSSVLESMQNLQAQYE
jgi:hypothetical protein